MKTSMYAGFLALVLVVGGWWTWVYFPGQSSGQLFGARQVSETAPWSNEPLAPLPLSVPLNQAKLELGQRLFHDPILSRDRSISCAGCHNLTTGGVDRRVRSLGIGGAEGGINAPTVFNSGLNFRQFWDGRADTLEAQVEGPLMHPAEMGSSWELILKRLADDSGYRQAFARLYGDGVQIANIKDAIATFERSLITPNSRFDLYLRGNAQALTEHEVRGYRLFKQVGCTSCHQGVNVGGNMFQKLGIIRDYFKSKKALTVADMGVYNVTKREEDRYFFKVPSLRNVALTAPYLHDGSAATLDDSVRVMGRFQLGKELDSDEVSSIVAFLRTLTGEYQGKPLE